MAKWANKDPSDTRDYKIEWADFLPDGETITNATVTVPDDLEVVDQTDNATDIVIRLAGGIVGTTYDVGCTITVTSGQIFDLTVKLKVADRILK